MNRSRASRKSRNTFWPHPSRPSGSKAANMIGSSSPKDTRRKAAPAAATRAPGAAIARPQGRIRSLDRSGRSLCDPRQSINPRRNGFILGIEMNRLGAMDSVRQDIIRPELRDQKLLAEAIAQKRLYIQKYESPLGSIQGKT